MNSFLILLFMVPGIIIFLLGRYLKRTGYVEVLKSYDNTYNYDEEGLTKYASTLMIYTGIITVAISILGFTFAMLFKELDINSFFLAAYVLVTAHYVIKLKFSCKKFVKSKKEEFVNVEK